MKRWICSMAFLLCLLAVISMPSEAAEINVVASGQCGDALTWMLDTEGTLTISGEGEMWNGYMYAEPCLQWSSHQKDVTKIIIRSGATTIGKQAFYFFENVKSVSIPDTVTSIGDGAFKFARNIEYVDIPDSVIYIGGEAFFGCNNLEYVELSKNLTHIWGYTFGSCKKLASIEIPYGVTYIGGAAFSGCESLREVLIPETVETICSYAFNACKALEYVSLPLGLSVLENCAFQNCVNLKNIKFPNRLEEIGYKTFFNCQNLECIVIPNGVTDIYSDAFYACTELKDVTLPDSVESIWNNSFRACWKLSSVSIPGSVRTIYGGAFSECTSLSSLYFQGNAPVFEEVDLYYADERDIFQGTTATAYYPANNPTWTEDVMQDYGGNITWLPYDPEAGAVEVEVRDLTEEDYLAFAAIAYRDMIPDATVEECLRGLGLWDAPMDENQPDITYGELCRNIAGWTVCLPRENLENGFYAVAFQRDNGEVVIAYRGSKPIRNFFEIFTSNDPDIINDWKENDLPMILRNEITDKNQFRDALKFYQDVVEETGSNQITTTGHSLGGLWGDVVSAYSGCAGVTFNAISALDLIYSEFPETMGGRFTGLDLWNFVDHANKYDILAGKTEYVASILAGGTKLKPFISYESDFGWWSLGNNHGLYSYINEVDGKVSLNARSGEWMPSGAVSNYLSSTMTSVDLGVSSGERLDNGLSVAVSRTSYGGNGDDSIITSRQGDTLVGGEGMDELDGSWGDDTYLWFSGDGTDIIQDVSGNDRLVLCDVGNDSQVEIVEDTASGYVDIYCNGQLTARIAGKNRASGNHSFSVEWAGRTTSISAYLRTRTYSARVDIRCPVDVQVLDAEGNVVFTLKNGEVGSNYTKYGNFYVFQEEDSGYGKVLDLVEGYTARVVGLETGTMDIAYYDVVNGELSEPQTMEDIPVSEGYVAELKESEAGGFRLILEGDNILWGDVSGDGFVDSYDAALILKHDVMLIGDSDLSLDAADVSGDGWVDSYDAALILKYDVMLIRKFPIEE